MIIKEENKNKKKFKFTNFFFKFYFYSTILFLILFLILFFNTGYWSKYKNNILSRLHVSSVINYLYIPKIIIHKIMSVTYNVEEFNLNISFENIVDLENQRINALKNDKEINNNNPDYTSPIFKDVNAKIIYEGKEYPTNIRIKGDRSSHWFEKNSVSYKFKLKGEDKIFGTRRFSLQKPRMRNYIHEWIFFELIGELDLIKLKYDFINLKINGENNNLYAFEENFDKILIERNKRRNGPIFSLYENFSMNPKRSKFDVYNKKYWNNKVNFEFTQITLKKLENFFKSSEDELNNFDEEKWAKFFAISDLNYYSHARINKSVRYYYNPVSALFEPVGYDAHRSAPNYSKYIQNWSQLRTQNSFQEALTCKKNVKICTENQSRTHGNYLAYKFFFKGNNELNQEFFRKYKKWIEYLTSENFLNNFFNDRKDQIKKINSLIYNDYFFTDHNYFYGPGIYYFSKQDIYLRAKNLRNYFLEIPDKIFIEQINTKLKITNLSYNNLNYNLNEINCINSATKEYKKFLINQNMIYGSKSIPLKKFSTENIICDTLVLLNDKNEKIVKSIEPSINNNLKIDKINKSKYLKYFLKTNNDLKLKSQITYINENIKIPSGLNIKISSGQKIYLIDNAFIFSNSPWIAEGKEKQIEISGLKDNFGGGLLISNSNITSIFDNVKFQYLNGLKKPFFYNLKKNYMTTISSYNGYSSYFEKIELNPKENILFNMNYNLMGSINFFNSNVKLKNSIFENICSEDAINIVSSNFEINDSVFEENCSDSIDVDFGEGKINNVSFKNIGNDAIDFSGSKASLDTVKLKTIGDKFISVGEESTINIKNVKGNDSFVGIVSKDGSIVKIENVVLENVKIGLAAYIKKKEFNEAKIHAKDLKLDNIKYSTLSDSFSEIFINNEKTEITTNDILEIIYKKNLSLAENKI